MTIAAGDNISYRKWMLYGLLVQLIAAWFSVGYNHYDEHFQVLEFCNYKLGLSPASELPWEFTTQCRGALQPLIAYSFSRALQAVHLYNPFWVAYLLRLCMGVLTWLVTCRIMPLLLPQLKTIKGKQVYVMAAFLLWFVAYCGVRFSAENIAGTLFFLAIAFILELQLQPFEGRVWKTIAIGVLLGFVFMLRLQMAFAYIGLGAWLIMYSRWQLRDWFLVIMFSLIAVAIGALADNWFYNAWVFTPYNYFKVNILQHAAAKFGVFPWWYYFELFFNYAIPPVSIVLLPLFFIGVWYRPRHLLTWVCIAFVAGHCCIGHKEMRFLLPVAMGFIYLCCAGLDDLILRYNGKWFLGWPLKTIIVINTIILFIKIIIPSHESIPYYQFIYNQARQQPTLLVSYKQSPYHLVDLNSNFYKYPGLEEKVVYSSAGVDSAIKKANGKTVLFLNPQVEPIPEIAAFKKQKEYCLMPDWVKLLDFNDWQSRSFIWTIYKLQPAT